VGQLSRYSNVLDDLDLIPGSAGFFPSPQHPDWLWGPPSLLSSGYWELFPQGLSGRGVKLTTHLHPLLWSWKVGLLLHSPICLHGMVLNWLSTGTTLPYLTIHVYTVCIVHTFASVDNEDDLFCSGTTGRWTRFSYYTTAVTSGTCKCKWLVLRKLFFGSSFLKKLRATVSAILADSFITSPRWPVSSSEPSPLSSWGRLVVVSMKSVEPPEKTQFASQCLKLGMTKLLPIKNNWTNFKMSYSLIPNTFESILHWFWLSISVTFVL
jgi:hypothetical protein